MIRRPGAGRGGAADRRRRARLGAAAAVLGALVAGAALPGQSLARCRDCRVAFTSVAGTKTLTVAIDASAAGPMAQQNQSIARGVTVAVDELNAAHGRLHVRLDPMALDALSSSAVQAQLRAANAGVLIVPCDTDSEYRLASEAAPDHVLLLAPCDPNAAAGVRISSLWSVGLAGNTEEAGLVAYMKLVHYPTVFIVNGSGAGTSYMSALTGYFRTAATYAGLKLTGSATVSLAARNFSAVVSALNAERQQPWAVFTALPPPALNRLASALATGLKAGTHPTTVFGTSVADTTLTLSTSPAPNGAIFSSYGNPNPATSPQFAAAYHKLFRVAPIGSFPGLGFDTIGLLQAAVSKAGSVDSTAIDRVLGAGLTVSGVGFVDNRTYTTAGDHTPLGEVPIIKVVSGSIVPLNTLTPAQVPLP